MNLSKAYWYFCFHSKKLPQAICNYGITELEVTGFVCKIHGFRQLLKHQYFEHLIDYKDIENLQKGKKDTNRERNDNDVLSRLHIKSQKDVHM